MLLGYNTNGFAHHDVLDAIEVLAEFGYQSVALTLDHGRLNPFEPDFARQLELVRAALERHGLQSVVETGARYLLDPREKHEPTLVSADAEGRARRVDFYKRALDAAISLSSQCVSLWSGVLRDGAPRSVAMARLVSALEEVLDYAASRPADAPGIRIAFEPEPGMFIDTMPAFEELAGRIASPQFALTLDVGHLHCQGEMPLSPHLARWGSRLANVHLEDMRHGVHEHLMFGEGEMDFQPIIEALAKSAYPGGVHVELSRHSHMAPEAARAAYAFLSPLFAQP